MRFRNMVAVIAVLSVCVSAAAEDTADRWGPVRILEGRWTGTGDGKSGLSTTEREYTYILGGNYMKGTNRSVFEPQEKNPKGEVHENIDFFSFDSGRGKIILRQFHVEGFTNTYVLDSVSADGRELVFVTEHIENGPPGMSARLMISILDEDSFSERFELSTGGPEYSCLITNTMKRAR